MKSSTLTRRAFLAATTSSIASAACAQNPPNPARVVPRKVSPNERLNVAAIGAGGKGREDVFNCRRENVVALCDVDRERAAQSFAHFDQARTFTDYRRMLDAMPEIDAVTVSTPDHMHAPAAYHAMQLGKHVYVQKPLTHTVAEALLLRDTARQTGVATQMGNQGHSGEGVRRLCEMIWSDAIGPVRAAHVWTNRPTWPQGIAAPLPAEPVPDTLDWPLWLGVALDRPYNVGYCPRNWRGWRAFGAGALGDMACHIMDPAFWALRLGDAETFTVEALQRDAVNEHTFPVRQVIKYAFPARGDMPPVNVYWYDGGNMPPRPQGVPDDELVGDGEWGERSNGSYFVGDDGHITCGEYGGRPRLLPDARMKDYIRPAEILERIPAQNHYGDWIRACKGGPAACSNFDYAAPFTVMVLMGCVALDMDQPLTWSNGERRIVNRADHATLITKPYRTGRELPV